MSLEDRILENEGWRNTVYKDTLGLRTIGVGHLITKDDFPFKEGVEYPKEQLMDLFKKDLEKAHKGAMKVVGHIKDLPREIWGVTVEMVFQLGPTGVSRFKKFIKALEEKDYHEAHLQMKDSRWHKQTKKRCESLAEIVRSHA